jgi:hypothetical protein
MIDLASCFKNGNVAHPKRWMTITCDCDRFEAIGQIDIDRCIVDMNGEPLSIHIDNTSCTNTKEDVLKSCY